MSANKAEVTDYNVACLSFTMQILMQWWQVMNSGHIAPLR